MTAKPPCPRCGTGVLTGRLAVCARCMLADDASAGDTIGGLALLEEIGRGGMGTVFKAKHLRLGRTVAVKFLPEELALQPEFQARFEREGRALALLDHHGIVRIHDIGQDEGQSFLVMEYVDGKPLSASIPLPVDRAVDVAVQVCDALAYSHARGVVHRDVKPQNILLDAEGRAKIGDFGIARIRGEDAQDGTQGGMQPTAVTRAGELLGTMQYMSPEALAGGAPDPRMDLYSLGVVLFQMVTGQLPIGSFDPLPGALDRIVRRALAPDPAKRYQSAAEMRADLLATTMVSPPPAVNADSSEDEFVWSAGTALLLSAATGVALWAILVSLTPRVIDASDVLPLTMLPVEVLADGRVVSRARFEQGPILGAVAALGLAAAAYARLRQHWRETGVKTREPDRALPQSMQLLKIGALCAMLYAVRRLVESSGATWPAIYVPLVGGLVLVAALYVFWLAFLESQRTSRALSREPWLFAGAALALAPPVIELTRFLRNWAP